MRTHDPRRFVEKLRDHLASHDRPIAFLFGAGTSAAVNIAPPAKPGTKPKHVPLVPPIGPLTDVCRDAVEALGGPSASAWKSLVSECEESDQDANVENVLTRLRDKVRAVGADQLLGLSRSDLDKIERTIRRKIACVAAPDEERIPQELPHHDFAVWVQQAERKYPVELFTTNYDPLLERALEDLKIPVFDGFVGSYAPFFSADVVAREDLLPGSGWVRLWKIHGSVNWTLVDRWGSSLVCRGAISKEGEMILPSDRKYDESRKMPYRALVDRLEAALAIPGALLVTCGFSFGDQHLNAAIWGALENRPRTHVISLQHSDIRPDDVLAKQAIRLPNLIVVAPNAAVLSGVYGPWRLAAPVDRATRHFLDTVFDSDFEPESEPAVTGAMRIGDFNRFCRFLTQMQPSVEGGA